MASTITQPALRLLTSFHANVAKGKAIYDAIAAAIVDIEAIQSDVTTLQRSTFKVRGVATGNVANLASFTVAGNDGITYVAGDRILLPIQTTAAQCGIYVVGTVTAGAAPLTRATDMPAAFALPLGSVVEVGPEGTLYGSSTWKSTATTTGGAVIGTNDPVFYPRVVKGTATLVAGTVALGATQGLWLLSTTKSAVMVTLNTPNTVTATTDYRAAVTSRTAGKVGTAAVSLSATKTDGTTDTDNVSTVDYLIVNW